jgi:hypothetical protein
VVVVVFPSLLVVVLELLSCARMAQVANISKAHRIAIRFI